MQRTDINSCLDLVMNLSLREQSLCVWIAVEPVVSLWANLCAQNNVNDYSYEYIDCYHRWYSGNATNEEFNGFAKKLKTVLSEDLRLAEDPVGKMAGWSLECVAAIGLDKCHDVHQDTFESAISYAVSAATENRNFSIIIDCDRLTNSELDYLNRWWQKCCIQLPQLDDPI